MGMHCITDLKSMIMTVRYHIFTISVFVAVTGLYLCFLAKVVPFDEIAAYRSDPRHVTKLMSRSGGLGVVSTAGTHSCGGFQSRLQTPYSGVGRRLVLSTNVTGTKAKAGRFKRKTVKIT